MVRFSAVIWLAVLTAGYSTAGMFTGGTFITLAYPEGMSAVVLQPAGCKNTTM
jgi:hypothetical protein